jgi:outer membrane protein assembly factor BamB
MRYRITCLIAVLVLLACSAVPAAELTWKQWRGPTRDGRVSGDWPDSLKDPNVQSLWQVDLDKGYSSPTVTERCVYTVETRDSKNEFVRCFDRKTGKQLWETSWQGAMAVPFYAWRNGSWIRSTPAADDDSIFVAGMRDLLVCLNLADGSERWRVDFIERYATPLPDFGFVSSPLVIGDAVYVQAGASFVKLDRKTGRSLWRTLQDEGGTWNCAFSSPMFATLAGRPQLLVQTRTHLTGVAPDAGQVLWKIGIPSFRGMNILNPTPYGDGVLMSSYGGTTSFFGVAKKDDALAATDNWRVKMEGYMSTPVVVAGHAYLHRRDRRMSCIDLNNGTVKWTERPGFSDYISLVTNGKLILGLDSSGELFLFRANSEKFELLDRRHISDQETWAHLAVVGDEFYVRSLKKLEVFKWKK